MASTAQGCSGQVAATPGDAVLEASSLWQDWQADVRAVEIRESLLLAYVIAGC